MNVIPWDYFGGGHADMSDGKLAVELPLRRRTASAGCSISRPCVTVNNLVCLEAKDGGDVLRGNECVCGVNNAQLFLDGMTPDGRDDVIALASTEDVSIVTAGHDATVVI